MKKLFFYCFLIFSFFNICFADNYLQTSQSNNFLLIAKPNMLDSRFKETVIYMLYHNNEGAAGLVINKPIEKIPINKLLIENDTNFSIKNSNKTITLHWGGPVDPQYIFYIHSSDYKSKEHIYLNNNITITQSPEILIDISNNTGPKNFLVLSGIAVWSPGQLDAEIKFGSWKIIPNGFIQLFENGSDMWIRLINAQEI